MDFKDLASNIGLDEDDFNELLEIYTTTSFSDIEKINLGLKENNAEQLRIHLLDQYGLGLISIGENNLRVAFSCVEERDLKTLFDIIVKGVSDLQS